MQPFENGFCEKEAKTVRLLNNFILSCNEKDTPFTLAGK